MQRTRTHLYNEVPMLSAIVVLLYFTLFFSGFIVDFQKVNVNWAESKKIKMKKKKKYIYIYI